MAKDVLVRIKGTDDLSDEFKKIGQSARDLGSEIGRTEREFEEFGRTTDDVQVSMRDIQTAARDVGLGIGVLVGGLAMAGRSFRDQEIAVGMLRRTYGDAADDLRSFADELQNTTNFSNDAVIESLNIAGTLARNYAFTQQEVMDVIRISADLAAASGLALEDATYRVVAALRGEAESAELLGLTMNQQAIDRQNLTLAMGNEEAAHFRLQALYGQSAFALGAANEQAQTTYGTLERLANQAQDAAQSLGGMLGPLGQVGAFAADNAIQIVALGLAFKQLISAAQGLNTISQALTGMSAARAGLAGLTALMTGPAGIVIAAGAAAVSIGLLARHFVDELPQASQASIDAMQELINKIVEAGDKSEYALSLLRLDDVMRENKTVIDDYRKSFDALALAQAKLMDNGGADITADMFADLTEAQRQLVDINKDSWITYDEVTAALGRWEAQATDAAAVNDGLSAGMVALEQIWRMTGEAGQFAQREAMAYIDALLAGEIAPDRFAALLQALIVGYENANEAALSAAAGTSAFDDQIRAATTSVEGYLDAGGRLVRWLDDSLTKSLQDLGQESVKLGPILFDPSWDVFDQRAADMRAGMQAQMQQMGSMSVRLQPFSGIEEMQAADAAIEAAYAGANKAAAAQRGLAAGIEAAGAAMTYQVGEATKLQEFYDTAIPAATKGLEDRFESLRVAVTGTGEALDSAFRTVVGNTNALASQSQAVADWADELIGAQGVWATIDDLIARNVITQEDYNAAVAAYTPIAEANARIQDAVLAIQVRQAPVLAELAEAQADYLDSLANAPADQQMFALAMMDSATSAQALQLAMGLLGENGAVFAPMIEQAANLNPYLASILEQMGLIEQMPDGTWQVVADVADAQSKLDQLNTSIEKLAYVQLLLQPGVDAEEANRQFEALFGHAAEWDDTTSTATANADISNALISFDSAKSLLAEWDNSSGDATVNVQDNATGTLNTVAGLLNSLDGRSVTTYVTTVSSFMGSSLSPLGYADGGTIPHLANGGTISPYGFSRAAKDGLTATVVGERGPELLFLPAGAQVMNTEGSQARMRGSSMPSIQVTIAGNVYGIADLEEQLFRTFASAWQRASAINARSVGR